MENTSGTINQPSSSNANRHAQFKHDFTAWLKSVLTSGWQSIPVYLPFLPLIWTFIQPNFQDLEHYLGIKSLNELLILSLKVQLAIIFCLLVYQLYIFAETDRDGLKGRLKKFIARNDLALVNNLSEEFFRFSHTNLSESKTENWEHFKHDFGHAVKNIFWFKISWMIMWVNWFCYYLALLISAQGQQGLFDIFMITESLSYFMCFYLLSYQERHNGMEDYDNFWWVVIVITLLVSLGLIDFAANSQDNKPLQLITSALKTLFSCTFLGLLITKLTSKVKLAPDWVKISLFFYVALQPCMFAVFDLPKIMGLLEAPAYVSFKNVFEELRVVMFNFSLVLKYILMFYVVWLLKFDHFLVHYLRTQGDVEFNISKQTNFEESFTQAESIQIK